MTYICPNCLGSSSGFYGTQSVTRWDTEEVYMDSEGEITDYGDSNTEDSEVTDGPDDVRCSNCDTQAIWFDTEEELEEYISENGGDRIITNWRERIENGNAS